MIGRLIEDAFFLGRFVWFYHKAPQIPGSAGIGFVKSDPTKRQRLRWAWQKASGQS